MSRSRPSASLRLLHSPCATGTASSPEDLHLQTRGRPVSGPVEATTQGAAHLHPITDRPTAHGPATAGVPRRAVHPVDCLRRPHRHGRPSPWHGDPERGDRRPAGQLARHRRRRFSPSGGAPRPSSRPRTTATATGGLPRSHASARSTRRASRGCPRCPIGTVRTDPPRSRGPSQRVGRFRSTGTGLPELCTPWQGADAVTRQQQEAEVGGEGR